MNYLLTLIFFSTLLFAQDLTFPEEDITFQLTEKYFVVEGNYLFRNTTNNQITKNILYPFPAEKDFGSVDSVSVIDLTNQKNIFFSDSENNITFNLIIPPLDSSLIHIFYKQEIVGDSVKYILTTTSLWNNPFESAEYKLLVDPGLEVTSFTYKPEKEYLIEGEKIYYWNKSNFMPDRDMVFYFEKYND